MFIQSTGCPTKYIQIRYVNSERFFGTLLRVAHHFTKWFRNHFVRRQECWPTKMQEIDSSYCVCILMHIFASSSFWHLVGIPNQGPFLLNLGGHKKAHITKLSKVRIRKASLSTPTGDHSRYLELEFFFNRNQSSKNRFFDLIHFFTLFQNPFSDMEEIWKSRDHEWIQHDGMTRILGSTMEFPRSLCSWGYAILGT